MLSRENDLVDLQKTLEICPLYEMFQQTFKRWTLYEDRIADLSKRLKDERRGHMNHYVSFERQSETKRKQAPQSEANVRLATSRPLGERSEGF